MLSLSDKIENNKLMFEEDNGQNVKQFDGKGRQKQTSHYAIGWLSGLLSQ